jgi:ribokinase
MKSRTGFDIVVLGGINTDYLVKTAALPRPGDTAQGESFLQSNGGKGANQAVAAARLGARVALIGRVGNDARGSQLVAGLRREGVDVRRVKRDSRADSGVALIAVDRKGEKQIVTAPGANLRITISDVREAKRLIQSARVLLLQLEAPMPAVVAAARIARAAGVPVVLDPAPAVPLPKSFLRMLHVIRPNSSEAKVLTGIDVHDRKSARRAAEILLCNGAKAAAVQAGNEGNILLAEGTEIWLPRIPVKAVDATGAGDAFAAAMAVGVAEGRTWEEAGWLASAAAALTTTVVGAQAPLPSRAELERFVRRWKKRL